MATQKITFSQNGILKDYTENYPVALRGYSKPVSPVVLSEKDEAFFPQATIPDSIKRKRIVGASTYVYARLNPWYSGSSSAWLRLDGLRTVYDEEKIKNGQNIGGSGVKNLVGSSEYAWIELKYGYSGWYIDALKNGIKIYADDLFYPSTPTITDYDTISVYPPGSEYAPYINLQYEDAVLESTALSPASGFINRNTAQVFSWVPKTNAVTIEELTQASAVLQWKIGESGTVNTINVGTSTQYVFPENTFPEKSDIYWRTRITSNDGVTEPERDWIKLTTTDSVPVVYGVSPSGSYISGGETVGFSWNYNNETGSLQTAYEVQYRPKDGTYTTVASGNTSDNSVAVSGEEFVSGTGEWRVRASNTDGVFSDWSNPLTFIVIAEPQAPSVSVSVSAPRPVIVWQSKEQQAFEVEIGEYGSGIVFGTSKTYQPEIYLEDGYHNIRVRVLNEFGLWSPWGETAVNVINVPESQEISLVVNSGIDAKLSWTELTGAVGYLIYRNGTLIARTSEIEYRDRTYLGDATYYIRAAHADGYNYTDSNEVAVTISVDHVMIARIDGEWLDIGYSLTSLPSIQTTRSRDVAMMQYNGAVLPIPEVSPFEQRSYSINCAFADRGQAKRFDELLGNLCCVKDQYGDCVVGMLYSYSKVQNAFTTAYTATLYEVDRSVYEEN